MDIAEMRKRKKEAGLTNARIAELSGVPFSTVNKVFSGATNNPRYRTYLAIEAVLREAGENGGDGSREEEGQSCIESCL